MSGSVVVVGSLNLDLAVRTERLPQPGETLLATSLTRSGGGKGANQAVAAARAGGARTSMLGAVGADPDGEVLLAALRSDGVDVTGVRRLRGQPTGTALITIDAAAENTIVVVAGANAAVEIGDTDDPVLHRADVVLAQLEVPQAVVVAAARRRRSGVPLILNAAPSAPLEPELLELVDLLVVNEHEAVDLVDGDDLESAVRALTRLVPAVLVTLGAAGARLVSSSGEDVRVAAPRVTPVDTVAAGDTFCGVYAAALADGLPGRLALERACAAASLAVQRPGAQSSIPTVEETRDQAAAVYG
jgi:ribokinase